MKKNLLFIIPSLGSGGAERGLITLLSLLNYNEYDVDLMLFRREGLFLKQVPTQVNVIDAGEDYIYFDGSFIKGVLFFIKHGKFNLATNRIKYMHALRNEKNADTSELVWKCLSQTMPSVEKQYDVSIGYLEGNSIYFCVDKTKAKTKIGYIHSDYEKLKMDAEFDKNYFSKLNKIVNVSKSCSESLIKLIPSVKGKSIVIENIISKDEIQKLSVSQSVFDDNEGELVILTVGRISCEKGIDLAVNACAILISKGYKIRWYVIGTGDLLGEINLLIQSKELEKTFILLGLQENPYRYMAQCDIYVQPSRYEGKSIAIDEAKALEKPIITTNFTTVRDQIENNRTGLIAKIDAASIADKIELLIENRELRESLCENLKGQINSGLEELDKFYALING